MANRVDPVQTAPPLGAVWSGSALFVQTYLSKNLGSLRYDVYNEFLFIPGIILELRSGKSPTTDDREHLHSLCQTLELIFSKGLKGKLKDFQSPGNYY